MAQGACKCLLLFFFSLLTNSSAGRLTQLHSTKTLSHDTIFPTTPTSTTPVIISPDTSAPPTATVPVFNPVTDLPTNPGTTPSTATPSTSPITTSPVPVTVPGAQPVITNPVTTYPAPSTNVPVTVPVTNPLPPPATSYTNAPAIPGQSWCLAKTGAFETALQSALDYACGMGGVDCSQISQGGSCYNPNTLQNHASYAFNMYYQKNPVPTSCDFGGTAVIVNTNPSTGSCSYPVSGSLPAVPASTTPTQTPVPVTTVPTPTPPTAVPTSTPPTAVLTPTPPTAVPTPTIFPTPPAGTGMSGYGGMPTPPTVLNMSNPGFGTTGSPTDFGSDSPPNSSTSASLSVGRRPLSSFVVVLISLVVTKEIIRADL